MTDPTRFAASVVDARSDLYSLGVVLFEMATGAAPKFGDGLSDPASVRDEATVERVADLLDRAGFALSTAMLVLFVYTIIEAPGRGWSAPPSIAGYLTALQGQTGSSGLGIDGAVLQSCACLPVSHTG